MKFEDALELASDQLCKGLTVEMAVRGVTKEDNIDVTLTANGFPHLYRENLEGIIEICNRYKCNVIIKDNTIIYA
jgi:hypothetical protein